jgi:two-component system phosphate regulon sensor histidine kinase PhoR
VVSKPNLATMKSRTIRLVVLFGTIVVVGLLAIQIYWVKNALDLKERQFNSSVQMALMKVVNQVTQFGNDTTQIVEPIKQLPDNMFVVTVNEKIYPNILESLLKRQFEMHHLDMDFEYGIYDCNTNNVLYGNYVNFDEIKAAFQQSATSPKKQSTGIFPKINKDEYYFLVHFPTKQTFMFQEMGFWLFSTVVLILVVLFFTYAIFVILKQRRLSEIQTDFINNMTHEFKTPLATISISTDVLLQPTITNNPERLMSYVTIIQDEANRLKNQVERVLQMAKLDKEKIKLAIEPHDIHTIIKQAVENLKLTIYNKNGKINLDLNAQQSIAQIDKLHIQNIIYNLLDNAIKYCEDDPVITIATQNYKKGIEIAVADNGIGIPQESQPYIFDKFYRVPTGNIHDVKGFGLGLNYVKIMVDAHKGHVRLKSEPNKGTTIYIWLPISDDDNKTLFK